MTQQNLRRSDKPIFSVVLPAPNPTGELHLGHAINLVIQDVLCRWQALNGRTIFWGGAVDHGGTATEFVVDRMLRDQGVDTSSWTVKQWKEAIAHWVDEITPKIYRQFRALDLILDLSEVRSMGDSTRLAQFARVFAELNEGKLIYRGRAVVSWCSRKMTTVDKADIIAEKAGITEYLCRYRPLTDGLAPIDIWVRHPETLVNDVDLIVASKHPYAASGDKHFVLSPLGFRIPVIVDDAFPLESEEAAHRITPGHCARSFRWAVASGTHVSRAFGENNVMEAEGYEGLTRYEAATKIVAEIRRNGCLIDVRDREILAQKFRLSAAPIEEFLTEQWFMKLGSPAAAALRLLKDGQVRLHPRHYHRMMEAYFEKIVSAKVENINDDLNDDWCISQQTIWGVPLDIGITDCRTVGPAGVRAIPQILNFKFSCAVWACCANFMYAHTREEFIDLSDHCVLVTGADLITWWLAPILLISSVVTTGSPARDIVIHPVVCDAAGRKMSKSFGNVVTPNELIAKYGSDALRFSLLTQLDLEQPFLRFDERQVREAGEMLAKCRDVLAKERRACDSSRPVGTDKVISVRTRIDEALRRFDFKAAMAIVAAIMRAMADRQNGDAYGVERFLDVVPVLEPFLPDLARSVRAGSEAREEPPEPRWCERLPEVLRSRH